MAPLPPEELVGVCAALGLVMSWTREAAQWVVTSPLGGAAAVHQPIVASGKTGTVTSVTSPDASVSVTTGTTTPKLESRISKKGVSQAATPAGGDLLTYTAGAGLWVPGAAADPLHTTVVTGNATAAGQVLIATAANAAVWALSPARTQVSHAAMTGAAGTVLLSARVPDDGRWHLALAVGCKTVTEALTGGIVSFNATRPPGVQGAGSSTGGTTVGLHSLYPSSPVGAPCLPGTTVTFVLFSAVTAGAATFSGLIVIQ